MALGIIGLLGFIAFLGLAIVSLFTKNGKAKKRFFISVACFILFIIGVNASNDSSTGVAKVDTDEKIKSTEVADDNKTESAEQAEEVTKEQEVTEAEKAAQQKAAEEAQEKINKLQYLDEIVSFTDEFRVHLSNLSQLSLQAGENPYIMYTDDWKIDMATALVGMDQSMKKVRDIDVPASMQKSHNILLSALNEFQFVVGNMPTAIDNMDADLINKCAKKMANGSALIAQATAEIKKLQ